MADRIQALGGEAVKSFSVGDIVGLALHNLDNAKGVAVVSDKVIDAAGRAVPGHHWTALGDAHLGSSAQGSQTKAMATAAVITSLGDLERVRGAGIKSGTRPLSLAQQGDLVRQALGGTIFAARAYVPREDKANPANLPYRRADGRRAPLDWRWGQLGDAAYKCVDETVRKTIAGELSAMADDVADRIDAPLGIRVYGIRNAYRAFVRHLRNDGIAAVEKAVGRRAR